MGYVTEYEVWIPNADNTRDHFLLVDFEYSMVDHGIGGYEWCGCSGYDSDVVPEVEIVSARIPYECSDKKREVTLSNQAVEIISAYIDDNYNFYYED